MPYTRHMTAAERHSLHGLEGHTCELGDPLRRYFRCSLRSLLAAAFVLWHHTKIPQLLSARRPTLVLKFSAVAGTVAGTMSYKAIIVRIKTRQHPKADRLQLAEAAGYTCIIGLDHKDGELGIVFPEGGQLAHDFCMVNKLYRKDPATGDEMGGYLEDNRRVRALKLRGVESNALWLPISAVDAWLGYDRCLFEEGQEMDEVKGKSLCGKYYTAATIKMLASSNPGERKGGRKGKALARHYDTPKLRSAQLPTDGRVIITEKIHGTSGRTGQVAVEKEQWGITKLLNRLPFVNIKPGNESMLVSGTRNCIVGTSKLNYRMMIHNMLEGQLVHGEEWFYEISGFEDTGKLIQPSQPIGKIGDAKIEKRLKREAGADSITYDYGCAAEGKLPDGKHLGDSIPVRFRVHVYRATWEGVDVSWSDMAARVSYVRLHLAPQYIDFFDVVPLLSLHEPGTWSEGTLREECDELTRGPSTLGVPIREGVCVRIETEVDGETVVAKSLKHKSWLFCALEGFQRNDPDFVDTEEVA